ncbi:activating transcription factor 4b isoform X1 [Anguilla anguilla]|uniref:activating transcription factor 4b isoform X1 n=1 Tax=Anguilla anguilla TaxID=7936 RepID=UPI0015B0309C|nr:activating transcription factor 4b isoform X1 [Anguilla anguilla]
MAVSLSAKPGLEDVEALLWAPSFLMAEPLEHLLDEDEEEILAGGVPSPLSSSSSYADAFPSSPLSSLSPPASPPPLLGCKAGADLLPLPWLSADELPYGHISAGSSNEDAFSGMDWMAEKMDLSEFDLDSLMDSCASDQTPSSSDELIASLESAVEMEPLSGPDGLLFSSSAPQEELGITLPGLPIITEPQGELGITLSEIPIVPETQGELGITLPDLPIVPETQGELGITLPGFPIVPEPQGELEIKSEPPSPVPSLSLLPPLSPAFTLDLGSEVDVSENKKTLAAEKVQVPSFVLSLTPSNVILLLAPKEEPIPTVSTTGPAGSESDSELSTAPSSPNPTPTSPQATGSSRTKPYSAPSRPRPAQEAPALTGRVKSAAEGRAPKVVEKKLKKMEQNKTAATRYRQKKRAEQEALGTECAELEQRNQELAEKAESISKEIQYLKDLIEEVRKAKSRKNKAAS